MFDVAALRAAHQKLEREHALMVQRAAVDAKDFERRAVSAKIAVHRRSGALARELRARVYRTTGAVTVRVSDDARHARIFERGSKRHIIRVRNKRALRFVGRGGVVFRALIFRRFVLHPGTPAFGLFERGQIEAFGFLGRRLAAGMAEVAARF